MADKAHDLTDKKLAAMEKRLSAIYARSQREIEEKAQAYFDKFAKDDWEKRKQLQEGKITAAEYNRWRKSKIMSGKKWTDMKQQIAAEYQHVNETALAYINGELPEIYALNYNALESTVDGVGGYSFMLTDADTVRNLAATDDTFLPLKTVNTRKYQRWCTTKINAEVLQGVIQGESIDKMAKRLRRVSAMDQTSAIRNARTMVTSAECKGRQDSYERAERDGIKQVREWVATPDARVRHSHMMLDGQLADVGKPFKSELGDIMKPGDPQAHPSNVYNCRCTMISHVIGVDTQKLNGLDYSTRYTARDFYEKDPEWFDIQQKMLYNEKADKSQFAAYKKRLGSDAPRSFSAFQNMKYRDAEKYDEMKQYYRYKGRVPEAKKADFELAKKIKEKGVVGTVRVPAAKLDVSNLTVVDNHAFNHGCTIEDAKKYIKNAKVSITRNRWDGTHTNFYSFEGAAYINSEGKVNTIYAKKDFKGDTLKVMEALL